MTLDGTDRLVQIKVTQSRVAKRVVALGSEPNYLLVFQVNNNGEFRVVYNGPGETVWNQIKDKPISSDWATAFTLSVLGKLNDTVAPEDRI